MTDEELRPCPFCQSTSVHTFSCVKDNGESKLGVQCGECGAEISRWFPWVADDERQKSLLEAVARWNNRATAIHGMDGDLLERLRATWCGHHGMDELHPVNPDGDEAADRIEALTAENEELREYLSSALETLRDAEVCDDGCSLCNEAFAALEKQP